MFRVLSIALVWLLFNICGDWSVYAEKAFTRGHTHKISKPIKKRKSSPLYAQLKREIDALRAHSRKQQVLIEALQSRLERLEVQKTASVPSGATGGTPAGSPPEPLPGETLLRSGAPPIEVPSADPGATPPVSIGQGPGGSGGTLNPDISVIGRFLGQVSTDHSRQVNNSLAFDEMELAFQQVIDPYARFDAFVTIPNRGFAELEEATITSLHLPWGLQARAGLLKAAFGRVNTLHSHSFPQVDLPDSIVAFFGDGGLGGPGGELNAILPFSWYSELTGQILSNDNSVSFSGGTSARKIFAGHWRNLWDLNENTTLELGLSWADGDNTISNPVLRTTLKGADLRIKWKPLRRAMYHSVEWASEWIQSHRDTAPGVSVASDGWFSYLNYQMDRRWWVGARYDETGQPANNEARSSAVSLLLTYYPTEFNQLRLQYKRSRFAVGDAVDQFFFLWNIVVGAHGAHKY